jgi:hypothetical protein
VKLVFLQDAADFWNRLGGQAHRRWRRQAGGARPSPTLHTQNGWMWSRASYDVSICGHCIYATAMPGCASAPVCGHLFYLHVRDNCVYPNCDDGEQDWSGLSVKETARKLLTPGHAPGHALDSDIKFNAGFSRFGPVTCQSAGHGSTDMQFLPEYVDLCVTPTHLISSHLMKN